MDDDMIRGAIDKHGRCMHHKTALDVVAFRFSCCLGAWACVKCHDEQAEHEAKPMPRQADVPAALCGACGFGMTPQAYLARTDEACPLCDHPWNPGCRNHEHFYFEAP